MKKLIIIFLLFATSCFAQIEGEGLDHGKLGLNRISSTIDSGLTAIDSIANAVGTGVTLADRVKDTYPVLYGNKRLWYGAGDSALVLLRDSDSTQSTIGFLTSAVNSLIDTTSITTFLTGTTGRVVRWVDQSGNGKSAVQNTIAYMPVWDNTVDSLQLEFGGVNDYIQVSNLPLPTYFSLIVQGKFTGMFIEHSVNGGTNNGFYFYGAGGNAWLIRRTESHFAAGVTNWLGTSDVIATLVYDGSGYYYKNTTLQANNTVTGTARTNSIVTDNLYILSRAGTGVFQKGNMKSLILINYPINITQIQSINTYLNQ